MHQNRTLRQALPALVPLVLLVVLVFPGRSAGAAELGGTVDVDTWLSLEGSPYHVTSTLTVEGGARLTVLPGVTLGFAPGAGLRVSGGRLLVMGSAEAPVLLTSQAEVAGGAPAAGDWGPVVFGPEGGGGSSVLRHVVVRYGQGIEVAGASPELVGVELAFHAGAAVRVDLAASPHGSGVVAHDNGLDAVQVPAGVVAGEVSWGLQGLPYVVSGTLHVGAPPTLESITPEDLAQDETLDYVLRGTRLSGFSDIAFSGGGIAWQLLSNDDTTIQLRLTADADAAVGPRAFVARVGAGEVAGTLALVPPRIEVTVAPADVTLQGGFTTQQFAATVINAADPSVVWSVDDIVGGDALVGTIDEAGLYTAPADNPFGFTVRVRACSVEQPEACDTALVHLTAVIKYYGRAFGGSDALTLMGLTDGTSYRVINSATGAVQAEGTLDRFQVTSTGVANRHFRVDATAPVFAYMGYDCCNFGGTYFYPSLDHNLRTGRDFVVYINVLSGTNRFLCYAFEDTDIEIRNASGGLVASTSLAQWGYWYPGLSRGVPYQITSTGLIACQSNTGNGYDTVPEVGGTDVGRTFLGATHGWGGGGFAVLAYEDADVTVRDLGSGAVAYSFSVAAGAYAYYGGMSEKRYRLEATGDVAFWSGDREGGNGIHALGDDLSFHSGFGGTLFYIHTQMVGSSIFSSRDGTSIVLTDMSDGAQTTHVLDADAYVNLATYEHYRVTSDLPIIIETFGGTSLNDYGNVLRPVPVGPQGGYPATIAFAERRVTTLNGDTAPLRVDFSAATPAGGMRLQFDHKIGALALPTFLDLEAGATGVDVAPRALLPGEHVLRAITQVGAPAAAFVRVLEATLASEPAAVAAGSLDNTVTIGVATDGAATVQALRVEIPAGWSLPDLTTPGATTARRSDWLDLADVLALGTPGDGPTGGTWLTLAPVALDPAEAHFAKITMTGMAAPSVPGTDTWTVRTDTGAGWTPASDQPSLTVQ